MNKEIDMASIFDAFVVRGVTLRNRIGVSPMCQYSAVDGFVNPWHLVHLGSRAVGGAGLVMTEATAVVPEGRITPSDLGIWSDAHVEGHRELVSFIVSQGAVPGIQLAHAGRKASRVPPWESDPGQTQGRPLAEAEGGWIPEGASPVPFDAGFTVPQALDASAIAATRDAFVTAAQRAVEAGYTWIEVHAAHGYLLHSFQSAASNHRDDEFGGSLEARCRLTRDIARAIRAVIPAEHVLAFRLSYTDWSEGGWTLDESVTLAAWLKEDGVDLIDVSSGGGVPRPKIPVGPSYQVPGAEAIRAGAKVAVAAVGWIDNAEQADAIVAGDKADLVMLARELLRDPYWPMRAALQLGRAESARMPVQYNSAWAHLGTFDFDPIAAPQITLAGVPRVDAVRHTSLA
ncbi:NADH:flavin oxidoreductase/NADH oxidase [Cupriavidus sp. 2SB]|uniref:NADH:flavin oxidoreductase/NADH oxidase n=1 Tax=Cupriavidus sp. 2SB TaxID=2502199 RepID=UPI002017C91F|nr:NADH:flavin oxidoreductase/NADH oxidase [Cupriavidus sp. 2SB]